MSPFPSPLVSAMQNGSILPLVGAGVSMSIKDKNGEPMFPGWPQLLKNAAQTLGGEDDTLISLLVKQGKLNIAAEYAQEKLIGSSWHDFLETQFDPNLTECDPSSLELPKAIWTLSPQLVTLNYDRVLDHCFEAGSPKKVTNEASSSIIKMMEKQDKPMVWHLHGHIDNTAEIILTPLSYEKLYQGNEHYQAALQALKTVVATRSLLFIGCSLEDADLLAKMEEQNELFGGNTKPHYALVRQQDLATIREKLKHIPTIQLISFEGFGAPLVTMIHQLAEYKKSDIHQEQGANVASQEATSAQPQIAYLSAKPLGKKLSFSSLENKLQKQLPYDVHNYPFTLNQLQNLPDSDYLLLACQIKNDKLVLENDWLGQERISFEELEMNLALDDLKGVILLCDTLPSRESLGSISLPVLAIPELLHPDKLVGSLWFQLFKKQSFTFFENTALLHNTSTFSLGEKIKKFAGKWHNNNKSTPKEITKADLADFIGRAQDLEQVSRELTEAAIQGECLTLLGTGGLGKTTLVKKLALEYSLRGYYDAGTTFIDCEKLENFPQFYRFIAAAFDLEDATNFIGHIKQNKEYQSGERLIIIDNAESLLQLTDSQKILELISQTLEFATLLVTSREPLNIAAEHTYLLRDFVTDEAVELFQVKSGKSFNGKELEFLRQHIVKDLLDNNPLAISLVAASMPDGKNLQSLKEDLEQHFFELVKKQETFFDKEEERNVDRKYSIYNCIDYSYNSLSQEQQNALIKLSLFPDGIDIENFKKLTEKDAQARGKAPLKDAHITALQKKSLLQTSNRHIRLHPLVSRFAKALFESDDEQKAYLQSVIDYNYTTVSFLSQLKDSTNLKTRLRAFTLFYEQFRNIITALNYFPEISSDSQRLDRFLDAATFFVFKVGMHQDMLIVYQRLLNNTEQLNLEFVKTLLITHRYYNGEFESAYRDLQTHIPLEKLLKLDTTDERNMHIFSSAELIYGNEGEDIGLISWKIKHNIHSRHYDDTIYKLGFFSPELSKLTIADSTSLSIKLFFNRLTLEGWQHVYQHIHPKDHIELASLIYLKAKLTQLELNEIDSLVVVNPYTQGIKYLLYALHSETQEQALHFFNLALPELYHIKYYYVEALYLYARWLKQEGLAEFEQVYQEGLALTQQFHFRYLQHCFLQLIATEPKEYNEADYPLPDGLDFNDYIQQSIKYCLKHNKQKNQGQKLLGSRKPA